MEASGLSGLRLKYRLGEAQGKCLTNENKYDMYHTMKGEAK